MDGMKPSEADRCLYKMTRNGKLELEIIVYVDDILLMASVPDTLTNAKYVLQKKFKMTEMALVK